MKNKMLNLIFAIFFLAAISHVTFAADTNETYCRSCHGNTVDTHHFLTAKGTYQCEDCHAKKYDSQNQTYYLEVIRNCVTCHAATPDHSCISCHDLTGTAPKHIDVNVLKNSSHKNLNGASTDTNKTCYACHGTGSGPSSGHSANYKSPKVCTDCHTGSGNYSAPLVAEHNQNGQDVVTTSASCTTCHSNGGMYLDNSGTNGTGTAIIHYIKDVTNMANLPYQHTGTINTSNCIECHNGAYTGNSSWGSPVNIATSPKRTHTETQTEQCDACHNDGTVTSLAQVDFHNASLQGSDIKNCLGCHTTVSSSDLGLHSQLNGTSAVENGDCKTCHYGSFPMVKGAVNNSNTYFCADCHTAGGNGTNKTGIKFTDKKHGKAACMECHVADGIYHQDDPRGSVANVTYASRDITNTNTVTLTECGDCHSKSNLDDAPFYAPGGGSHANGACINGGCHGPSGAVVQVVHNVNPLDSLTKKPTISTPTLDHSTVTQGTDVNITATVNLTLSPAYANALVDGAQYQINNSDNTLTIRSWTPMIASDGDFNTIQEGVKGRINTSTLSGTYNIAVRGMAGGPSQDPLQKYYPMNGDVSTVKSVILNVQPLGGYINGTIKSNGSALGGAFVSTTGASYTTGSDGKYSLSLPPGTYVVTASKQPVYIDVTVPDVIVTASNTTYVNITMDEKLKGTITGSVTTV